MKRESHFQSIKVLLIAVATILAGANQLIGQSLAAVLKSPKSYQHKRVAVVGILRGEGPVFELYDSTPEAIAMRAPKAVHIRAPNNWRPAGPYDLRRVRVTGVIDANWHGVWGNPCSLSLEKIEVLSGPVAPWPDIVAVFRNENERPVWLRFGSPPDSGFMIQPQHQIDVRIQNTIAQAFSPESVLIAKAKILKQPGARYFDKLNAAAYYRIAGDKIEQVLPSVAKGWGWHR